MLAMQKTINRLLAELEAERIENARFRRMMEDLLYNLEDENMPAVSSRIREGERSIGLLVEDGAVRGSVLVEAINGTSAVTIDADKINLDGRMIVETINGTSGVTINADRVAFDADSIDLDGKVIVQTINDTSGVTIDADRVDLDGRLIGDTINGTSGVTINADHVAFDADDIDLDGKVIVQTINEASGVSIRADKIDLNGAVTANENFVIHEDGSVACKALSLTGGAIHLPDPGDGTAVLRVETENASGGVTVFADRIAFDGQFVPGWVQEGDLSLEQLRMASEVEDGTGVTAKEAVYVRPSALRLTYQEVSGNQAGAESEGTYTARGITLPYLRKNPVAKAAGMIPLYIDKYGRLCAVSE
jgi:phage baseplate assembly protein gpV